MSKIYTGYIIQEHLRLNTRYKMHEGKVHFGQKNKLTE